MSSDLNRREVLQGAAAAGMSGVLGSGKESVVMPALFVSHGSPMVALETDAYPRALAAFGEGLAPPRALVVVSAHWETPNEVRVTASESPPLLYDCGGFPEPLYHLKYPSPGAPVLASDLVARLGAAGLRAVADAGRGLDHNLRRLAWQDKSAPTESWAREFDGWVAERLAARDFAGLQSWTSAPHARLAHPSAEHLLPLFFVLGAALPEDRVSPVFEGFHYANLSMRSFALRG